MCLVTKIEKHQPEYVVTYYPFGKLRRIFLIEFTNGTKMYAKKVRVNGFTVNIDGSLWNMSAICRIFAGRTFIKDSWLKLKTI